MQSVHGIQVLVIGGFHKLFGKTLFVFAYKYPLFNKIKVEIIYNATSLISSEDLFEQFLIEMWRGRSGWCVEIQIL